MAGEMISLRAADGGSFGAYVAAPEAGHGPGLLLFPEIFGLNPHIRGLADLYAEEGYLVFAPDLFWRLKPGIELGYSDDDFNTALSYYERFDVNQAVSDIGDALTALRANPICNGKAGALGFGLGGTLAYLAAARLPLDAAIAYYGVGIEQALGEAAAVKCPVAFHFAAEDKFVAADAREAIRAAFARHDTAEFYVYRDAAHGFNNRKRAGYHPPSAALAYSRTLGVLRRAIGPRYDLDGLWERHTGYEFGTRDADATMRTMVAEPYVNHVPTMTGGVGQAELARFYRNHFVNSNPKDTRLIPISRTIGADRLVDEMLFCFTHDVEIDWMLPGVAPTGRYVEVPLVAIINFRGPKLYHEHIYWDQASVLAQ
ncbi:MAG TPA: dienelactone hydrolase family protein, partial [Candidatus Binataceae bacterium]|nr:dienelactone hydrolase family protein [Candidatus Binataceae bacterium]